jgi:ribonuclease HII
MASVTVAQKSYVDAAINTMVIGASVNGSGHLILTRKDLSTFDAGDFSTAITNLINTVLATATLHDILSQASAVAKVPLTAKGFAAQTADLQQWMNSAATVLAKVDKDGKLTAAAITGTVIDGSLNTLSNINAAKIDSHKVTVNTTAPSTPATGDIWINPSGT